MVPPMNPALAMSTILPSIITLVSRITAWLDTLVPKLGPSLKTTDSSDRLITPNRAPANPNSTKDVKRMNPGCSLVSLVAMTST